MIGRIHGNLLIGLSYGWWISKHTVTTPTPTSPLQAAAFVIIQQGLFGIYLGPARPGETWMGRAAGRILVIMRKPARAATRRPLPGSPFNTPSPAPEPVKEFTAHDLVSHDRYGLGRVISTEADAVLVDFGTAKHRISAPYAKLTKL